MLPHASVASSSRSIQGYTPRQHHRPGPNPVTLKRRYAFKIDSIKTSPQRRRNSIGDMALDLGTIRDVPGLYPGTTRQDVPGRFGKGPGTSRD